MTKITPRVASVVLVLTLCISGSIARWVAAATGESEAKPAPSLTGAPIFGKLMVTGPATINGKKALPGSTIFSENRIAVANTVGNGGRISLGRLGNVDVKPGTELVLRFSDKFIGGELLVGEAIIRSNAGVKVALLTPKGWAAADGLAAAATLASSYQDPKPVEAKKEQEEQQESNQPPTPPNQPGGGFGGGGFGGGGGGGAGGGFGGGGGLLGLGAGIGAGLAGIASAYNDSDGLPVSSPSPIPSATPPPVVCDR